MNKTPSIFKDEKLQQAFEKNGFLKVPLLSAEQADALVALFSETRDEHAKVSRLHHTTTDTYNPDLIYKVDKRIKEIFVPELNKILDDYRPLIGSFHIKEPATGSATGTHQDPTFVDEPHYYSANVWVALHDMDTHNGNLYFVSGSNQIVSLRVTPSYPSYYESFSQELPVIATQVPMKKGEAVIFYNGTIHGATDNLTDKLRLACTLLICSKAADWVLYYHEKDTPDDKIERYVLDLDSFIAMPKDSRPDQKTFTKFITYDFPRLTKEDFLQRTGIGEKPKRSYLQRIKEALGV